MSVQQSLACTYERPKVAHKHHHKAEEILPENCCARGVPVVEWGPNDSVLGIAAPALLFIKGTGAMSFLQNGSANSFDIQKGP